MPSLFTLAMNRASTQCKDPWRLYRDLLLLRVLERCHGATGPEQVVSSASEELRMLHRGSRHAVFQLLPLNTKLAVFPPDMFTQQHVSKVDLNDRY